MADPLDIQIFADDRTRAALEAPSPRVLLLGGYLGYPNFGDILQLQGTIAWHRQNTDDSTSPREPVIVCDAAAVTDPGFIDRLRTRLGIEAVLFLSTGASLPKHTADLTPYTGLARCSHLHLYGGGYLNRLWGHHILQSAEHLIERFGVGHYVMSGQQAEPAFVPPIRTHIQRCRPVLVGGRDDASVTSLVAAGAGAMYSFDDAAEQMGILRGRVAVLLSRLGPSLGRALIHLNVSPYAAGAGDAVQSLVARVESLLGSLTPHVPDAPCPDAVLLNAYNDARVAEVSDTLGVVLRAGDRFPLETYRSLHLGSAAFDAPGVIHSPVDPGSSVQHTVGLVCSYHAAMLCQMLGVPVWLEVRNAYYRQKAVGLGLVRTIGDSTAEASVAFDQFLQDRPVVLLDAHLARRQEWLVRLAEAYAIPADSRLPRCADPASHITAALSPASVVPPPPPPPTTPTPQDARVHELQAWIEQLEAAKAWLTTQYENYRALAAQHEAARAADASRIESLSARVTDLTQAIDRHHTRANLAEEHAQAALNRIAQLQGGVDWLHPQYESWKKRATELHVYVEELLPAIRHADESRAWLEAQRANWESIAKRLQTEKSALLDELERTRTTHASQQE